MSDQLLESRAIDKIFLELKNRGAVFSSLTRVKIIPDVLSRRGVIIAFETAVVIEGKEISIQIGLDTLFPLSLPIVRLTIPDSLGFIPHVEPDGTICYSQREGLLLNRRNPIGIIEQAVEKATITLCQGVCGDNVTDFTDEFEVYWNQLNGNKITFSFVEPNSVLRKISVTKRTVNNKIIYIAFDDINSVNSYFNVTNPIPTTHYNALYIPLKPGTLIIPPTRGNFWSTEDIQQIVKENLDLQQEKLLSRLTHKWKSEEIVVFRMLRPSGGVALFGIHYTGIENGHPLTPGATVRATVPLFILREDKAFLLPRGGANQVLSNKRVLLIGCGAVGGFIAVDLIRAGILNLTLLDSDILSTENTFRHVLGKEFCGTPKVSALKTEIERKFPYTNVVAIHQSIEEALNSKKLNLGQYHLVIVATGNPTVNLHLNEVIHTKLEGLPTLFTWLEAHGIGGHALLTGNSLSGGCLECLFTPAPGDSDSCILYNRASFSEKGQTFATSLTGCGGSFTPYSALHAIKTATLAVEMAIGALSGNLIGNPLISWRGNSTEFQDAGYKISSRYGMSEEEMFQHRYDYYTSNCKVCGRTNEP